MENEDQQVEQVKKFLKEYAPWVVAGLVIGLGSLFGWRYYQDNQLAAAQDRTTTYQEIVDSLQFAEDDTAVAQAQQRAAELGNTEQAALTHLQLAQVAVNNADLATAQEHLSSALNATRVNEMQALINVRLARVTIAAGDLDSAESHLNAVTNAAFQGLISEVRGDLYLAQGDHYAARDAYEIAAVRQGENASPYLQMKIDNLAGQ